MGNKNCKVPPNYPFQFLHQILLFYRWDIVLFIKIIHLFFKVARIFKRHMRAFFTYFSINPFFNFLYVFQRLLWSGILLLSSCYL